MAAKQTRRPLPKYMTGTNAAYKYQRRVPTAVVQHVGRKIWDLSLGSDLSAAVRRCEEYTSQHDQLIDLLKNDTARQDIEEDSRAIAPAANLASMLENEHEELEASWRDTETYIEGARVLTPRRELETLAVFAQQAFGDTAFIDQIDNPTPYLDVAKRLPPAPIPDGTDKIERAMFEAMKGVLDVRMEELNAIRPRDPDTKITARMEQYIRYKAVKDFTARGYRMRIARFVEFAGDLPLEHITPALLRLYRDKLLEEVSRSTVAQYFYPMKSLFRWAMKEEHVDDDPSAKVDLPRNDKTVEETRWQAFNDAEIATVWHAVSSTWGPDSTSRLSPERRAIYTMVFRVMLWTGMRPNEVFKLTTDQVEADRIHVKKTKTGAARIIPLAAPIADFHTFIHGGGFGDVEGFKVPENKMSDYFTKMIRKAGLTNNRHVLYSLKDTMLDRLEALGASENVQRSIIGHMTGRGALRNYKTSASVEEMRGYLDRVTYCDGL